MKLSEHYVSWSAQDRQEALEAGMDPCLLAYVRPADGQAVQDVLAAEEESPDGRSGWMWVRLPNGDLILGVYPQGDTYFATEGDHSGRAPREEAQGERAPLQG